MKHILYGALALTLSFLSVAQAAGPERQVRRNALVSKQAPAITVKVPRSAVYVGADRWDLYDICDAELHVFVEADRDKNVKALYWIQFEQYLPSNTHTYNYGADEPVQFAGRDFWQRTEFAATTKTPRAGSDGEHVRKLLEREGYTMPKDQMNVRLVQVLDETRRRELMFIYLEDLAPTGFTAAQLMDGKEIKPEWQSLKRDLVKRAMQRIQLLR